MVWQKLGSTTLGSAASSITVSSLASSPFLKLEVFSPTGGSTSMLQYLRLNGDTGTSYAWNYERNGVDADPDSASGSTEGVFIGGANMAYGVYTTVYISNNIATKEKLVTGKQVADESSTGANGAVAYANFVGKWIGSAVITSVTVRSSTGGGSDFPSGAEVTVYGSDETITLPLLSNGAIFEESDTGKHYMFDCTDTWNEVT